ncbi:hypothetical protein IFM89_023985 [Coptis chinensis]|uniref:NAC-A/B domain-containing protein n=1 Tax=Coptis chinensis TaxID=261450 RepID=A0A835HLQ6_9MAGN|nr:hypothetical protein IFM89_023985 [Coptis chinensis]
MDMEMAVVDQSRSEEAEKKSQGNVETWNESHPPARQRHTIKKSKNILFVISKPDVFKSPTSDTYVIFGEAKIEDLSSQLQTHAAEQLAAEQFKAPDLTHVISKPESSAMAQNDEDVDETGVEPKDRISDDAGWCVKIKGSEGVQGY